MEKRPKGALFRLVLAVALCSLFLGHDEGNCDAGHDSGTLFIENTTQYIAVVNLTGPVVSGLEITVGVGKSHSMKIRTGTYHWFAVFIAGMSPVLHEMDVGVATVTEDEPGTITIKAE